MALPYVFKAVRHALKEVQNGRNQDNEVQKRTWGSSSDLEQQQTMPNFSRPRYPSHPSYAQGYKGRAYTPPPSIAKSITNSFLRFLQFAFALTVAGLYGRDLHLACDKDVYLDAKWVYAEIVAALAAATSAAYLLIWCCVMRIARPALTSYYSMHLPLWFWEMFMCVLWLVLFGIFGKMYLPENPEGDLDIVRMKHAVWVDLVNLLLWTATMIWSGLRWWQGRVRENKEGGNSSEMKKEINLSDRGGGGGRVTPPVASGAAPVSMPEPLSFHEEAPRTVQINESPETITHPLTRQDSPTNADGRRSVSPL